MIIILVLDVSKVLGDFFISSEIVVIKFENHNLRKYSSVGKLVEKLPISLMKGTVILQKFSLEN